MDQSLFVLSLLVFVYTMAEFAFIRDLSERCPRTGLRALRLSGPLPGGVLPDDLAIRLWVEGARSTVWRRTRRSADEGG